MTNDDARDAWQTILLTRTGQAVPGLRAFDDLAELGATMTFTPSGEHLAVRFGTLKFFELWSNDNLSIKLTLSNIPAEHPLADPAGVAKARQLFGAALGQQNGGATNGQGYPSFPLYPIEDDEVRAKFRSSIEQMTSQTQKS